MEKEIRIIRKPLELRAAKAENGDIVFTGYVFAWDSPSDDLGGFQEIIRRGATTRALANPKNLFAILDHEKKVQNVLGDRQSGTLSLFEDERGLAFTASAGDTQAARDAAVVAARNNIGVSFAFSVAPGGQKWSTQSDGTRLRELVEFRELDDISLVVDAAYKSSDVTVARRSLEESIEAEKRAVAEAAEKESSDKRPDVAYLTRMLDQQEIEFRSNYPGECSYAGYGGNLTSGAAFSLASAERDHDAALGEMNAAAIVNSPADVRAAKEKYAESLANFRAACDRADEEIGLDGFNGLHNEELDAVQKTTRALECHRSACDLRSTDAFKEARLAHVDAMNAHNRIDNTQLAAMHRRGEQLAANQAELVQQSAQCRSKIAAMQQQTGAADVR